MIHFSSFTTKYPRASLFFLFASFINSFGSSFMWPLITLYVHNVLGRSFGEAGFVLLCQSVAAIIGQYASGVFYHRIGVKRLIVASLFTGAVAQISLIGVSGWYLYVAIMMFIGFLNALALPAIQAYMGFRWKEQRRELFNFIYVGNNIGMAIGTSVAGLLASLFSFSANFLMNGLTTILYAAFFFFFVKVDSPGAQTSKPKPQDHPNVWGLLSNVKLYLFMALGSMLIWFSTSAWNSGIAPHLNAHGNGMAAYSLLWTVNGVIIFAGQPLIGLLRKFVSKSLPSQLIVSSTCYAAGFALILLSQHYAFMIAGMVITTFGEMLIAPTVPAFITEKAGQHSPFYLGIVGAIGTFGRVIGPYALGMTYDFNGVVPVLFIASLAPVIATLLFGVHASFHRERQARDVLHTSKSAL